MTVWALRAALDASDAEAIARYASNAFTENPVTTALALAGATAPSASLRAPALAALGELLQIAPPLALRSLDQAFRSPRRIELFRIEMNRRTHGDLVDERRNPPKGSAILASLSRDGYLRGDAVRALGRIGGRGALNALLVRTSDPVGPVRDAALDFVGGALKRAATADTAHDEERLQFAHALPLIEQMQTWARTRTGRLPADIGKMLTTTERGRAALAAAAQSEDRATRQAALRVSLDLGAPGISHQIAIVGAALMDGSPRIRLSATRRALSNYDIARVFFERFHVDKSPHIRALALKGRAKYALEHANDEGVHGALARATFDHNANVRFWARHLILKFGSPLDYRERAKGILVASQQRGDATESPGTVSLVDLVGALATLSEFGRVADVSLVEPFVQHPRRRVHREAARTLEILRRL